MTSRTSLRGDEADRLLEACLFKARSTDASYSQMQRIIEGQVSKETES